MKTWKPRALIAASGMLGGCTLLAGLDDVSIVQDGTGGAPGTVDGGGVAPPGDTGGTSSLTGTGGAPTSSSSTGGPGGTGGDPATSSAGSGGETSSSSTGGAGGETSSSSTGGAGGAMPMPCGDGAVGGGEQCDDGNATGGDGCSASCQIEPFFQCSLGAPSVCAGQEVLCGDGVDNDGDAFIDGLDTDCVLPAYAPAPPCPGLRIYRSINVPVVIPDGGEASSPIVVADTFQVEHTAVLLDIAHPYTGDLDVRLIPPFGSPRNLTTDNGGSGDDYSGTLLDSECAGSVISGSAPFSDCYKPESSLPGSAQEAHGTWTLSVGDDSAGQTGTLEGFTLILCGQ